MAETVISVCLVMIVILCIFIYCSLVEQGYAENDKLWKEYHEIRERMHLSGALLAFVMSVMLCA